MFNQEKIYMPVPQQLGRGDRMGRGPYEKSGLLEDTGLPPGKTVRERFDIFFPTDDVEEGGTWVKKILAHELQVEIKLWYLPFGTMNADPFLWQDVKKTVTISTTGK